VLALFVLAGTATAARDLKVVTTLPDLADIAREVGGELVDVQSICRGKENLHAVTPRPSHLVALSRADVFVQFGLGLEATWLPGLLQNARNAKIVAGEPGFIDASVGWDAIQIPTDLSRKGGDVHPLGNPHANMDPRAGKHMADRILKGFVAVDPGSKEVFERNHAGYLARLERAGERWARIDAAIRGEPVVSYHKEFDYLMEAHGLEGVGTVEVKPGIPPTPAHVAKLIETMKTREVRVILTASWSNNRQVKTIAERTGATVVELPHMVGGAPGADSWVEMMDVVHERLATAFGVGEAR
jgi:zinc/manganese transport system substrate-binding protein